MRATSARCCYSPEAVSFKEYAAHGWRLCSIDRGHKAPLYANWNAPETAERIGAAAEGLEGAGLLHALSGTCALDIDYMESARPWLAERGVDIDALLAEPEAVRIDSGRPGRAKLLYRLKKPLRTLKPKGSGLELRCATADGKSVQDVLPPTIHPDTGKPYAWKYGDELIGHWSNLPPIPAALLALWREATPALQKPTEAPHTRALDELRGLIRGRDPNGSYDDWIKVGMALHHATGGAQEGLALWDEWSSKAAKYKGTDDLLLHWRSFNSSPGKHVVTAASLQAESAASADDFPEIAPDAVPDHDTTAELLTQAAELKRSEAFKWLESRLIYVRSHAAYFDTAHHSIIETDRDLAHQFTPFMPKTKGGRYDPVKALRESKSKRVVASVGFHPGQGAMFKSIEGDEYVNLYRNRLPEPIEPTAAERERIEWLFERIDDATFRDWLKMFYGHVVQFPSVKIKSAPLIWSPTQGNGKTTLLRNVPALLVGQRYSREVTAALLNSDFNDYLLNAWHVNLAEFRADTRGERRTISAKLRAWITDDEIAIHPKGRTAYTMPNHFFVTATSNEDDAAAIDNNDRRWGVHELNSKQFTQSEQRWLYDEFLSLPRAAAVLRHYFLNLDVSGFNPNGKAPETDARQAMVEASMPADMSYLRRCFEERSGPLERDVVRSSDVGDAIRRETRFQPSPARVGRLLTTAPINGVHRKVRVGKGIVNFIIIANVPKWLAASGTELAGEACGEIIDITA
jgi:Primase C terminal 2 (PriCT-2)/Bifunctional DNA primase/polymerase, N-terminal/Family of unknown function (DUF5906)